MDKYTRFAEIIHAMTQQKEARRALWAVIGIAALYVAARLIEAVTPLILA